MARKTLGIVALWGMSWLSVCLPQANAQSLFDPFGSCCPQVCCPPPPVCVPQYTQVPVTEMREVKQTVMKPVQETKYVDQQVTTMVPVQEVRTVQIPTVSYQTVTENHTRMRDCGRWMTSYQCRPKMSPCQYDNRPGLFGWLNRSAYQTRMAFTPNMIAQRQYVPNMVAESIPVSRQVAVRGVQEQQVTVMRMEPRTETRKVAVTETRYVAEVQTIKQPVTVMKTVPTAMAYGWNGSSATALVPTPLSEKIPRKTAENMGGSDDFEAERSKTATKPEDNRSGSIPRPAPIDDENIEPTSLEDNAEPVVKIEKPVATPSAVHVGKWVASKRGASTQTTDVKLAELGKYTRNK